MSKEPILCFCTHPEFWKEKCEGCPKRPEGDFAQVKNLEKRTKCPDCKASGKTTVFKLKEPQYNVVCKRCGGSGMLTLRGRAMNVTVSA